MLKIYAISTERLTDRNLYERVYKELNEQRKQKVDAIKSEQGKKLSLAAGWLLSYATKMNPNLSYTNLTHTLDVAACAISDKPVGIDAEKARAVKESVIKKCFTEDEQIQMRLLMSQAKTFGGQERAKEEFARIWTRKESAAKLTGEGIARIMRRKNMEEEKGIFQKELIIEYHDEKYFLTVSSYDRNNLFDVSFVEKIDFEF